MKKNSADYRQPAGPTVRKPAVHRANKRSFLRFMGMASPVLAVSLVLLTLVTYAWVMTDRPARPEKSDPPVIQQTTPTTGATDQELSGYLPEGGFTGLSRGGRVKQIEPHYEDEIRPVISPEPTPYPVFYDTKGVPQEPVPVDLFTDDDTAFYVLGNGTNIRENPQTDSPVVQQGNMGDVLSRTGYGLFWSEIKTADGQPGYVLTSLITTQFVAAPTPTPTLAPTPTAAPTKAPTPSPLPTEAATPSPDPTPTEAATPSPDPTPAEAVTPNPEPTESSAPSAAPTSAPDESSGSPLKEDQKAEIVSLAKSCLGIPYVFGGTTTSGFDCSGFTQYIYKTLFDITIPRLTYGQVSAGISVSRSEIEIGDIICLDWEYNGNCDHVALYVGDGMYIDASYSANKVRIREFTANQPVLSIRRIIH